MSKQSISLNAAADRPFLMFPKDEWFAVNNRTCSGINIKGRQIVLLENVIIKCFIIDLFNFGGKFPVIHHKVMETVEHFIFILPGSQSCLFVNDINKLTAIVVPDFSMNNGITQVQNKFQQIKGGHPVEIVLIDQIPVFPVGIDFPTVGLFIIDDFNFTV